MTLISDLGVSGSNGLARDAVVILGRDLQLVEASEIGWFRYGCDQVL